MRNTKISIFADVIQEELGISTSALSGANIADEVARDRFCETTVGYRTLEEGELWRTVFQTPNFRVQLIDDVIGVSLCGALKNVIAIAAGIVDGLGYVLQVANFLSLADCLLGGAITPRQRLFDSVCTT